jgi:hypothetical protein
LEGDSGVIAVEVAVLDEVLDGVDDLQMLLKMRVMGEECMFGVYLLQKSGLLQTCFKHCEDVSYETKICSV